MSLLEFPLKRFQFTIVVLVLLCALGWSSFKGIPRQEDPQFSLTGFNIATSLPGATPQDMEQTLIKPLEDRISELDDLKKVESRIEDGAALTTVHFFSSVDPEKKYDELVREINALRPDLPAELVTLDIQKVNPGLVNIVQYALVSEDATYAELEEYSRQFRDRLRGVSGVRTAENWAFPDRELQVVLDLRRMTELRVMQSRVIEALQSGNADIPGGVIDIDSRSFSFKTSGGYRSLDEIRETVIAADTSGIVRLRDIATVSWGTRQHTYLGRFNGQRAVFVTATQRDGANIFDTQQHIVAVAEKFARGLPKRIRLEAGFDQSENVARRLDRLFVDFTIALLLVLVTLLPLGLRAAGVVIISVPLSLAIGVTVLYLLGYSLNQISISAFILSLGLLVDDSIVVIENISRHMRDGHSRHDAALLGTRQIALAVVGCTAALMFAFLPLVLLPGDSGKFIRALPVGIIATIGASLVVSLLFIPFFATLLLEKRSQAEGNRILRRLSTIISRCYQPPLRWALARPLPTLIASLAVCFLVIIPITIRIGFSVFPKADTPHFLVLVKTPEGSSLAETDRALRYAESLIRVMPQVQSYFSNLGHGNPKIYYNVVPHGDAANYAEIFVKLKEYDPKTTPRHLDVLRQQLRQHRNANIEIKEFESGPAISAPISIRVVGPELAVLQRLAAEVERVVGGVAGTSDVVNPIKVQATNLRLAVDPQKAALLGVPAGEISRAIRLSVAGVPVGKFRESNGEQYNIVVRGQTGARTDWGALDDVRVASVNGGLLPLSQLAHVEFAGAPTRMHRYNRERAVVIDAQVQTGFNAAKVTAAVLKELDSMQWPRGYSYVPGGELETRQESFRGLGNALLIAVLGIVAILVLEFGSFKSTLIVLAVVPFGVAGGILMLGLTGNSISFTASIGLVALIGIDIKNSILLVDCTNQLRASGVPLDEAIARAGQIRILPILLTSATALGAFLPLALQGSPMYAPLAWVLIGGLGVSTLVARIVTPVVYKLIPPRVVTVGSGRSSASVLATTARVEPSHE